jgi:hypothetical protein
MLAMVDAQPHALSGEMIGSRNLILPRRHVQGEVVEALAIKNSRAFRNFDLTSYPRYYVLRRMCATFKPIKEPLYSKKYSIKEM